MALGWHALNKDVKGVAAAALHAHRLHALGVPRVPLIARGRVSPRLVRVSERRDHVAAATPHPIYVLHLALLIAALACAGCGDESPSRSVDPAGDRPVARRHDPQAIDAAIAAVERGQSVEIVLRGIQVSDADLQRIGRVKNLETLDLGAMAVEVTDEGLLALRDLADLRVLVLGSAPITDRGLAVVRGMRELRRINVVGARITDEGLAALAELPKLELLRIGGPSITDAGMEKLAAMRGLRQLILVDCPLTDACLPHLKGMTHLESLYIHGSAISDAGRDELEAHLKHVHFE